MTPPSTILAPDRERATAMAWGTLSVLALTQIVLTSWLLTREPAGEAPVETKKDADPPATVVVQGGVVPEIGQIALPVVAPPPPGSLAAPLTPAVAPQAPAGPPQIGSFELPGGTAPAMTPPPVQAPAAPAAPTLPGGMPAPPNEAPATPSAAASAPKPDAAAELLRDVGYVLTTAKEIRGLSDMQGALELLKRADQLNPDHPGIIAEIAQTYEQMGIADKATDNWRRIQLLGEVRAGSFFQLAARRLGAGSPATAPTVPSIGASGTDGERRLMLGACQIQRDLRVNNGERYVLRVPILRAGSQPVDPQAANLEVFFFDRVNGAQVAQTIAPEPLETWQSSPVDWSGAGEETLDVIYHLPALTEAEVRQHGRRSYYGYMLRLYHNNKLQDVAAEPRDLLEFGSPPGASPAGGNPLLPPVGR